MREALRLAEATGRLGNVPVGAVVVVDGEIVGRGANLRDTLGDPTAHAELLAIREASQRLGSWRLDDAIVHVTLEPCAMCAGAIVQARPKGLVYGAEESKTGAIVSTARLLDGSGIDVRSGHHAEECASILAEFFRRLRGRKSNVR